MTQDNIEKTTDDENPDEFVAETTGQPEIVASKERTLQSEIQVNIELLNSLGVEVDEAEVKRAIEEIKALENFDGRLFVPQSLSAKRLIGLVGSKLMSGNYTEKEIDQLEMPRSQDESYAIAFRYTQEPDDKVLGRNAANAITWESPAKRDNRESGKEYMNLREWILFDLRFMRESGEHIDEKHGTLCAGSRISSQDSSAEYVPWVTNTPAGAHFTSVSPSGSDPAVGPRRVITSETKAEE